jgi:hypothetical protein
MLPLAPLGAAAISARQAYAISPHATNEIGTFEPKYVWVGGAGNITYRPVDGTADVLLSGIPAGTLLPISPSHVRIAGTTATLMVALV